MKNWPSIFPTALLLASTVAGPLAHADFVHLSFFSNVSSLGLRGNQAGEPWDTYGYVTRERPVRLDIFYDPNVPASGDGYYPFTDPGTAFWRLHTTEYHLPPINILRPLDSIQVGPTLMTFSFWTESPYASFDMTLNFATPLATGLLLPTPPFPKFAPGTEWSPEPNYFMIYGGQELFNLPAPGGGMMSASFTSMRAELVDEIPPLSPVPEPATYGLVAALALGGLAVMRRRRTIPAQSGSVG